jgi:hypothetical protein
LICAPEHLQNVLIARFDVTGDSAYHDKWREVADRLRQANLEPLIKDITMVLDGAESWGSNEPKGADALLNLADKLEEAHAILERDESGWLRVSEVYLEMDDRLPRWAEVAREAHRGQGRPREGYGADLAPHLIAFWEKELGQPKDAGKQESKMRAFCEIVVREIAIVEGIDPDRAQEGLVGALRRLR